TVRYGDDFRGIARADFATDGKVVTGSIDGRAVGPFPVGADPRTIAFADGKPAPTVSVDPNLQAALNDLWQRAVREATTCSPVPEGPASPVAGTTVESERPECGACDSPACILCTDLCAAKTAVCYLRAAVEAAVCGPLYAGCLTALIANCNADH